MNVVKAARSEILAVQDILDVVIHRMSQVGAEES